MDRFFKATGLSWSFVMTALILAGGFVGGYVSLQNAVALNTEMNKLQGAHIEENEDVSHEIDRRLIRIEERLGRILEIIGGK